MVPLSRRRPDRHPLAGMIQPQQVMPRPMPRTLSRPPPPPRPSRRPSPRPPQQLRPILSQPRSRTRPRLGTQQSSQRAVTSTSTSTVWGNLPHGAPVSAGDVPSQEQILQQILWDGFQIKREQQQEPTAAQAAQAAEVQAPAVASLTPLERLAMLYSDTENTPSMERVDLEYLISLFTDVQKSQWAELANVTTDMTDKNDKTDDAEPSKRASSVPTVDLTFRDQGGNTVLRRSVSLAEIDTPGRSITVPHNFLGIREIPFIKVAKQGAQGQNQDSQWIRLALPQMIEIEQQRPEPDEDLIEVLHSLQAHL